MLDGFRLLFQALCLQGSHPGMHRQPGERGDDPIAGRILVGRDELLVVVGHLGGHLYLHLRQILAARVLHVAVGLTYDMEHDVIVARVVLMAMQVPVGRAVVNLDVAHPQRPVDFHLGIEEVGPCIAVVQSWVDDLHLATVGGRQCPQRQHLMFPHIV